MPKTVRLELDSIDAGQLLDGLRLRAESWRKTAEFLDSGYIADAAFLCEECTDADEANRIAQHYERIIGSIEQQLAEQGGW
jgi:hypothetical protein